MAEIRHGSARGYAQGCRCAGCTEAKRLANRVWRAAPRRERATSCPVCGGPIEAQAVGRPRHYCSRSCARRAQTGDVCECGAWKGRRSAHCQACAGRLLGERMIDREMREKVERLWKAGLTFRELAAAMGWANWRVAGTRVHYLRSEGVDLPYRRSAVTRRRMRAAARAHQARRAKGRA